MDLLVEKGEMYSIYAALKGHAGTISKKSQNELINDLKNVDALIIEADERSIHEFITTNPFSVEALCWLNMNEKPREFIQEHQKKGAINRSQLIQKYNINNSVAENMLAAYSFSHNPSATINPVEKWYEIFDDLSRLKFSYPEINPKRGTDSFFKTFNEMVASANYQEVKDYFYSSEIFIEYIGKLREFEYWQTEISDFRKKQKGKIGICCGKFHVPFVKQVLEEQNIEKPLDFSEFIIKNHSKFSKYLLKQYE